MPQRFHVETEKNARVRPLLNPLRSALAGRPGSAAGAKIESWHLVNHSRSFHVSLTTFILTDNRYHGSVSMANPSQLYLLADHIKLSLLERQRAISLNLEPNSQDGHISRSLDQMREGVEALERSGGNDDSYV